MMQPTRRGEMTIFQCPRPSSVEYNSVMIRIREILDPELRKRIVEALAERRGCSTAAIPDWFELDDADYVDLLNQLKEAVDAEPADDPRM
jgi:hypothetical protein